MVRLPRKARAFIERYSTRHPDFTRAARDLEAYIADSVADLPIPIHVTTARAKRPTSLRSKCRRKNYRNPAVQVTDLLAVRVITYFKEHIETVIGKLRARLDVSAPKSRDARKELAENQFGYRSIHLIARLRPAAALKRPMLGRRWFEIQVRSILDHAWSEIEHETIYKSGIRYPLSVRRRFKALAAALEVLEDAFASLTAERAKLVQQYTVDYIAKRNLNKHFDVARLEAFLLLERPHGISWEAALNAGAPFPHGSAATAVEALDAASLNSPRKLSGLIRTRRFRTALGRFAAIERIAPETASHLAVVVLCIALTKPQLLQQEFPEIVFSPAVDTVAKSLS